MIVNKEQFIAMKHQLRNFDVTFALKSPACSCLHGVCDNRVDSLGKCKPYSCNAGYTGADCDIQVQKCDRRLRIQCHAFADCVKQDPKDFYQRLLRCVDNATNVAFVNYYCVYNFCYAFLSPIVISIRYL